MIQLISIEKDDIVTDPRNAGRIIGHALDRNPALHFAGLCDVDQHCIQIVLDDLTAGEDGNAGEKQFIFTPFQSSVSERVSAVIRQRYDAGFSTLAAFSIGDTLWGLFCKQVTE